jgi:hypothetical protein
MDPHPFSIALNIRTFESMWRWSALVLFTRRPIPTTPITTLTFTVVIGYSVLVIAALVGPLATVCGSFPRVTILITGSRVSLSPIALSTFLLMLVSMGVVSSSFGFVSMSTLMTLMTLMALMAMLSMTALMVSALLFVGTMTFFGFGASIR